MCYREGYDKEVFMEKGEVYKVDLIFMVMSNYFKKGYWICIEVLSSNFFCFVWNLNIGGNNYDEFEGVIVNNKVYYLKKYVL